MKRRVLPAAFLALLVIGASAHAQQAGDPARGRQIFNRCRVCHTLDDSGASRIGPNLYGVIGRKAGSFPGYHYSDAMKKAGENGLVWTADKIDAHIANPRQVVPGNKMTFAGLQDPQARRDVIAYIDQQSQSGAH